MKRDNKAEYTYQFADNLNRIMRRRGIRAAQIVSKTGINTTSVYNYMNGAQLPHAYSVAKLALALGVDANELLGIKAVDAR